MRGDTYENCGRRMEAGAERRGVPRRRQQGAGASFCHQAPPRSRAVILKLMPTSFCSAAGPHSLDQPSHVPSLTASFFPACRQPLA